MESHPPTMKSRTKSLLPLFRQQFAASSHTRCVPTIFSHCVTKSLSRHWWHSSWWYLHQELVCLWDSQTIVQGNRSNILIKWWIFLNLQPCRSSLAKVLSSIGCWMTLSSIIVICVFLAITWFDYRKRDANMKVELPAIDVCTPSEGAASARYSGSNDDAPPSYASVVSEVPH